MYFFLLASLLILLRFGFPLLKIRLCDSYIQDCYSTLDRDKYRILTNYSILLPDHPKKLVHVDLVLSLYGIFIIKRSPLKSTRVLYGDEQGEQWSTGKTLPNPILQLKPGVKHIKAVIGDLLPDTAIPYYPIVLLYPKLKGIQLMRPKDSKIQILYPKTLVATITAYQSQNELLTEEELAMLVKTLQASAH